MAIEDFSRLTVRLADFRGILSLVGTTKNAGKTTILNYLLRHSDADLTAVTSLGRDGEDRDVVERHRKPSITLAGGVRFATAQQSLQRCRGRWLVTRITKTETPLGPVVICRAEQPCSVELAGPSQVDQLAQLAAELQDLGARRVLIDGAFDRVAAAAGRLSDAVVLAVGSSGKSSVESVVREATGFLRRFSVPELPADLDARDCVSRSSLTDDYIEELQGRNVLLPDASGCLIEAAGWPWIDAMDIRLWVKRRVPLLAVFVNPFRPHRRPLPALELLEQVRDICRHIPVYDLKLEAEILHDPPER